jgi:hypothetical protein
MNITGAHSLQKVVSALLGWKAANPTMNARLILVGSKYSHDISLLHEILSPPWINWGKRVIQQIADVNQ